LATTTWATSRSVGRPLSISRAGAGACTTAAWQARQAYFGRRVTITWYCAGTTSSRCERSSPITCIAPPQRKNALFAGRDEGAENWAMLASLIETCKLYVVNPEAYLTDVLTKLVNNWPNSRLAELTP
jgi:hypothetical protein